ncbi:copper amine oxidase N-terminal domain-containing protein [Brevibacillus reuszeri]|uniref:copper amine oxidase N-terminal domain-containing protein n=1 Tax=Brevibacillus reuszeri TaxID=54915 RepID=UPI003D23F53E
MNSFTKVFGVLMACLLLFSTFGLSRADAFCYGTRNYLPPLFGEVDYDEYDGLSAYIEVEPAFTEFMYLIATDSRGNEKARIRITSMDESEMFMAPVTDREGQEIEVKVKSGWIHVPQKSLKLSPGDYDFYLEVSNFDSRPETASGSKITGIATDTQCGRATLQSDAYEITIDAIPNSDFPGFIDIKDEYLLINLNLTAEYTKGKFSLLIIDENGKVVKRNALGTKKQQFSSRSISLEPGTYKVQLEMILSGKTTLSNAVTWVIQREFIDLGLGVGQSFPGKITITPSGAITITLQGKQDTLSQYDFYFIVRNADGKDVRHLLIDPKNPSLAAKELSLPTGLYSLTLKIYDPRSQQTINSESIYYTANQSGQIIVFIDGQLQTYNKPPVKINSRVLVPMRAVFEAFGAKVDWDEATESVTATTNGDVIKLTIGSKIAYKNGQPITMDVPAILYNNQTTMVPIRFVSEALGATVSWDNYSNSVIISR